MSKTIKEIADELGVSKTAIRNKMTDDFREKWVQTLTANGVQTLVILNEIRALKPLFFMYFYSGKISKWIATYENKKQKSLFVGHPHKQTFNFLHFGEIPNPLFSSLLVKSPFSF